MVNFAKRRVICIHVDPNLLDLAGDFLHSKKYSLPFKYLGLPLGVNPRFESIREPLVSMISRWLNTWRHQYVSLEASDSSQLCSE